MARARAVWITPLVALISTGFALAVAQERGNNAQPAPIDMGQLLLQWEGQSAKLKTLEVSIYRIDKNPAWGEEEHYQGHAAFKTPQLAFLDFRKVNLQVKADPKAKDKKAVTPVIKNKAIDSKPYETIVCTGQEVWHYRYDVKQIFVYPLDKNQRKRALEEGPLPFLFNMRAAEAKQRYEMVLQGQDEKKYLVMIKPLLPEDKDSFSLAWVYLDKGYLLPTRIYLLAPDRKSSKDFQLSDIHANDPVKERYFVGVDPGKPWKVERNPGGEAAATAPTKGRPARKQAGTKAAQRPAAADAAQPR
jgi:TIGR03009 family protein